MNESIQISSLVRGFDRVVRDPVWGDMAFSDAYLALAGTEAFAVTDRIRQLGPVHIVYPGATHTRKAHSLGVFHLSRRLALSIVERGQIDFAGGEGLRSFLAAALCHDIGHYPFAHSLKELPLARHEALAADMIVSEPLRSAIGECGADPDMTAAIVDGDRPSNGDREIMLFRTLLSGVLDPDKIDYLTRDAYYCGVPYGVQDANYIIRHVVLGADDRPGVDGKGIMSVEGLLFSKYLMYRSVYWHPGVRAATSMVRKSVAEALEARILAPEELYGIDDGDFFALVEAKKRYPLFAPALAAFSGNLYRMAAEIPFDPANPLHCDIMALERRREAESTLAAAAGLPESDVVVDVPEPISFEADLPVHEGGAVHSFGESDTVFKPEVVARFPHALRRVRVFMRAPSAEAGRLAAELLS